MDFWEFQLRRIQNEDYLTKLFKNHEQDTKTHRKNRTQQKKNTEA